MSGPKFYLKNKYAVLCVKHVFRAQQDSHCTNNVILSRVRETIAAGEGSKYYIFWECVCVYTYLSNMQNKCAVSYYHLWPLRLYHIYSQYLIKGTIFGNKVLKHKMCVFLHIFYLKRLFILKITRRDMIKLKSLRVKYALFLPDFKETWFKIKSNKTPSRDSLVPCGLTDGQTRQS